MKTVDVNVTKLGDFDLENELYYESLWNEMLDDGEYVDNGCDEAVGFICSNACHIEVSGSVMRIVRIKNHSIRTLLTMTANDLVNSLMGTEQKKFITEVRNGVTLLTDDDVYLDIFVNFESFVIQILAYM